MELSVRCNYVSVSYDKFIKLVLLSGKRQNIPLLRQQNTVREFGPQNLLGQGIQVFLP